MERIGFAIGVTLEVVVFGVTSLIIVWGMLSAVYLIMRASMWVIERTPWLKGWVIKWRDDDREYKRNKLLRLLNAMSDADLEALVEKVNKLKEMKRVSD